MFINVYEAFVFAYSKIGYSSLNSVIYPFWTQGKTSAITASGSVVVCDQGVGTVSADGSIVWSPLTLPVATGEVAQVWGAASYSPIYALCGESGGDVSLGGGPCVWISADNGATWSQIQIVEWYGLHANRIRFVNGKFVTVSNDGHIASLSTPFTAYTIAPYNHARVLNDIAFGGGYYLICGVNGYITYSSDLLLWTSVGPGTSGLTLNALTYWSGSFYVAGVNAGGNGKIYKATTAQMLAGTWVDVTPSGTLGTISDFIAAESLLFVSDYGVWATDTGLSWVSVTADGVYGGTVSYGWMIGGTVATVAGNHIYLVGSVAQILTSTMVDQAGTTPPTWTPWSGNTPTAAMSKIRAQYFGGLSSRFNPIQWTENAGFGNLAYYQFGIGFDPPSAESDGSPADAAAAKICEERWICAGEMISAKIDGSSDNIATEFPVMNMGNIQDLATMVTIQYAPFGGSYLLKAYIQNVDVDRATAGKPDSFFFGGWDTTGTANGLALWTLCRAAYLATGILRSVSLTYDSVHDGDTMGRLWTSNDVDLGKRIFHIIKQPRYIDLVVDGHDSGAAVASCGARYKINQTMLNARAMPISGTGYGIVVACDHDYIEAKHSLTVGFPPS